MRNKVEKLHRIHIAFYDGPLLDTTQYYQNLTLCQGPFLLIDGKESVLYPGNYDLMIYSLKFFQTCMHLARMRLNDPPEYVRTSKKKEKEARAKFSLSSLIKEQVLLLTLTIIRDIFSGVLRIKHTSNSIYVGDGIQSCAHHLIIHDLCLWKNFVGS